MSSFHFSTAINETYYDDLEKLFYFNPGQSRYFDRIVETVETFGQPKIVRKNGMLVMQIENLPGSSCIFLCYGPKLVGVMIYFLESKRDLRLLHVAVDEEFTIKKNLTLSPPMGLMIDKLIEIASGFANVKTIKIDYLNRSIKI